MMNKRGAGGLKAWHIFVALGLIVVFVFGGIYANNVGWLGGDQQTGVTKTGDTVKNTDTQTVSSGCAQNPSVTTAITDGITGASISPTVTGNYILTDLSDQVRKLGTTAPTERGTVDAIFNTSNYISTIVNDYKVGCNAQSIPVKMNANASATVSIYNNAGTAVLAENVTNETVSAAGGSYNWKYHFVGVSQKSTGKQLLVVELGNSSNLQSVSMSGAQSVPVPGGYNPLKTIGSVGKAYAFLLPSMDDGAIADFNLQVQSNPNTYVTGYVYNTIYQIQPFINVDGSFNMADGSTSADGSTNPSYLAFDSLNAVKYHDVQTKIFGIGNKAFTSF